MDGQRYKSLEHYFQAPPRPPLVRAPRAPAPSSPPARPPPRPPPGSWPSSLNAPFSLYPPRPLPARPVPSPGR